LILAGAMFIAVVGIRQSMRRAVIDIQHDTRYDVDVDFSKPYQKIDFENRINRMEGVVRTEAWSIGDGRILFDDGTLSGSIVLIGVPDDTRATQPKAVDGRFLLPPDKYSIFINADTLALADLKVGSKIRLRIGASERDWTIVGVGARGFSPVAYIHYDDLSSQTGADGFANRLIVQGSGSDPASQALLQSQLLGVLNDAGYEVSSSHTTTELKESTAAQMDTLIVLLMAMVILIAIVGGLGLAITMGLNVMERTREIGIMRSLGAQNGTIRGLVVREGLMIALMSWILAVPLSMPLSTFLGNTLGVSLLATPLEYIFPVPAIFTWLGLIVLIAVIASLIPAQNAARLTIRDTLVYE
jgi:putative ABC transport system permease protein